MGVTDARALRAAVNLNNTALVQKTGEAYTGLAPDIARRIAAVASLPLRFVDHPSARAVVEAAPEGWDIAFLAIDPSRADRLAFSRPYHRVEATFLIRDDLPATSCAGIVAGGHRIVSARGAAYHAWLAANVPEARLIVAESPAEATRRFLEGQGDALAGIRDTLAGAAIPGSRVLADLFASISQAVAVPVGRTALLPTIDAVLEGFSGSAA